MILRNFLDEYYDHGIDKTQNISERALPLHLDPMPSDTYEDTRKSKPGLSIG